MFVKLEILNGELTERSSVASVDIYVDLNQTMDELCMGQLARLIFSTEWGADRKVMLRL